MKKLVAGVAIVGLLGVLSFSFAAKPENPGCFGQDRAAIIKEVFIGNESVPGASGWGAIAAERGSTNGAMNRAYKASCGGDPS